jgi:hypothetical protein
MKTQIKFTTHKNQLSGLIIFFLAGLIMFGLNQKSSAQITRTKPTPTPEVRQTPPPMVEMTKKQIADLVAQTRTRTRPVSMTPIPQKFLRKTGLVASFPDVDLRPEIENFGIAVRDQGGRNTCSVFAVTFLHEYMWNKYSQKMGGNSSGLDLSEEYLNYVSNAVMNEWNDGGFFDELDAGYHNWGIIGETNVPYQPAFNLNSPASVFWSGNAKESLKKAKLISQFLKKWDVKTGLTPQQFNDLIESLKKGRPVAAGLRWAKPGKFAIEEIYGIPLIKMVGAGDVVDGHSVVFVGYKVSKNFPGGGYLIFRNSWGTGFGEQGYGYMSFEYATAYTNDLFLYTTMQISKPPYIVPL